MAADKFKILGNCFFIGFCINFGGEVSTISYNWCFQSHNAALYLGTVKHSGTISRSFASTPDHTTIHKQSKQQVSLFHFSLLHTLHISCNATVQVYSANTIFHLLDSWLILTFDQSGNITPNPKGKNSLAINLNS